MVCAISYTIDANVVTKRAHAQIMREINRGMLERWRDRYLPMHFQAGATTRYGYEKRSAKYTARKRKKYGHSIPLVYTGRLRDTIRENMKPPTATQYKGSIKSRGYFPMKAVLRSEIERVMPFENAELAAWALKQYTRMAKDPKYARKRTRRGGAAS